VAWTLEMTSALCACQRRSWPCRRRSRRHPSKSACTTCPELRQVRPLEGGGAGTKLGTRSGTQCAAGASPRSMPSRHRVATVGRCCHRCLNLDDRLLTQTDAEAVERLGSVADDQCEGPPNVTATLVDVARASEPSLNVSVYGPTRALIASPLKAATPPNDFRRRSDRDRRRR